MGKAVGVYLMGEEFFQGYGFLTIVILGPTKHRRNASIKCIDTFKSTYFERKDQANIYYFIKSYTKV